MWKAYIWPRSEYGFRDKPRYDARLEHVRVLEHIRGRNWKVEWIDPNPGLVHYAESGQLLCFWKDHRVFLDEEKGRQGIKKRNKDQGYLANSPLTDALYQVFESLGERDLSFLGGDVLCTPEAIERVRIRAKIKGGEHSPYAYIDRQGITHLPYEEALVIAKNFCAAEPSAVLPGVEATEREWARKARTPGRDTSVSLLNEFQAAAALIRQWTGHDPAIAQREQEIRMLERLVWDAIYSLQKAGQDKEASRLRRVLER